MTSQKLQMTSGLDSEEESIVSAQDSPVRPFQLLDIDEDFWTLEALCFSRLQGPPNKSNHAFYSLKTCQGYYLTRGGETFAAILATLDELGHYVEWQVLNSKNFGVPQNRERVFIIGVFRGHCRRKVFPLRNSCEESVKKSEQVVNTITTWYGEAHGVGAYLVESESTKIIQKARGNNKGGLHEISPTITSNCFHENNLIIQVGNLLENGSFGGNPQTGRVYSTDGLSPCLNTMQGGQREPKILLKNKRIRKLTPRECWRLQGFPDWAFDRAKEAGVSNTQLYKQAGNSVTVNVIYEIARRLE